MKIDLSGGFDCCVFLLGVAALILALGYVGCVGTLREPVPVKAEVEE